MNQPHYSQAVSVGYMPTHDFMDRQDSQAYVRHTDVPSTEPQMMSNIPRYQPFSQSQMDIDFLQSTHTHPQAMPPSQPAPLALNTAFATNFQYPISYGGSVSAMPQFDHHSSNQWAPSMEYVPMSAPASHMRNSSMSTFSSSPVIKSEESSPLQPLQVAYGSSTVPRSFEMVDLEESRGSPHSTNIDVLMKAIQSKSKSGNEDESRRVRR